MMNLNTDEYWMSKALSLAQKASDEDEVPVGAVLVKDGVLVGQGYNQSIKKNDPSAHAEILALRQAGQTLKNYRLVGTVLYVTLEPCAMCAMALVHARVEKVVFATREPRTGAAGSLYQLVQHSGHNHQIEIVEGVLQQRSADLLKTFFKQRR